MLLSWTSPPVRLQAKPPEGERIEIQIRTEEMHRQAEHGVAAHWLYKEKGRVNSKDLEQFSWLREIFERQGDEADSREFMHSLKLDLFKDEVYVYTPAGDVKELPEGATPLDFAFLIHTQVGSRCVGAKVNGKLVPLNTALKSGDTVEIITDKNRSPSRDWLKIVKSTQAKNKINQWFKNELKDDNIIKGKELMATYCKTKGIPLSDLLKNDLISCIASDAHHSYIRTPHMSETKTALVHIGGYGYAWHLTDENPERIIKNIQIPLHGRRPERRKKYFMPV